MALDLNKIIIDFARAFKEVDALGPVGRTKKKIYKPGIGPLKEEKSIELALSWIKKHYKGSVYQSAGPSYYPGSRKKCDVLIPDEWAIEFKMIRPYGDNGKQMERWFENIMYPYPDSNISSIGDCYKLLKSDFTEKKAIIVFGYEHIPAKIKLELAVQTFELIAKEIHNIKLGPRCSDIYDNLIHPFHQRGLIYGWELL